MIAGAVTGGVVASRRNRERNRRLSQELESVNSNVHQRNTVESVENDMDTLHAMFPSFDDEVLFMLLQQNSYQLPPTIEMLLAMSATDDSGATGGEGTAPAVTAQTEGSLLTFDDGEPLSAPAAATEGHFTISDETEEELAVAAAAEYESEQQAIRLALEEDVAETAAGRSEAVKSSDAVVVGIDAAYSVSDEQLAFMLANDALFQQELAAYFGEDFMIAEYMQQYQQQEELRRGETGMSRPSAGSGSSSGVGDLGVVRGLAEIGSEMRGALNRFTLRYMSSNSGASDRGGADAGAGGSSSRGMQRQDSAGSEASWLGGGGENDGNDVELVDVARNHSNGGGSGFGFNIGSRSVQDPSAGVVGAEGMSRALALGDSQSGGGGSGAMGSDELGDEDDDDDDDMETINLLGSPMHQGLHHNQNQGQGNSNNPLSTIWTSFSGNTGRKME